MNNTNKYCGYYNTKYGNMYYQYYNYKKDKTIVWLHGWGKSGNEFISFCDSFNNYNHLIIDLLGFGKSSNVTLKMCLIDYVDILNSLILSHQINNIYLVGHSFGGRIAILYASIYNINKLFLVSAKAFKNKTIKHKINILRYKVKKYFLFIFNHHNYKKYIKSMGSKDYQNANSLMKKTMKNVVNYDLTKSLKKIKCKTVVLGSVYDNVVSYDETLKIYNLINHSVLYPFYRSFHFLYLEEKEKFIAILNKELK